MVANKINLLVKRPTGKSRTPLNTLLFVILNFVTNLWPANRRFERKLRMTNKSGVRLFPFSVKRKSPSGI